MQPSSRKWLFFCLVIVCLVAVARIGIAAYEYLKSEAAAAGTEPGLRTTAAEAAEGRFRPSEAVRNLLDRTAAAAPRLDGKYACVFASFEDAKPHPQLGKCAMPTEHSGSVDRFEVDLRYGNFVVRQSDLYLNDVFDAPLTRTYNSGDYLHASNVHAFGRLTNHPFDISPVGSHAPDPYTYQLLVLEDGDFLYFPRVSEGTSFSDAVYQHTETSGGFYKAATAWNGNGWTIFREDGTTIVFPDSYNATKAAQGAPIEIRDGDGNRLELIRDGQRNLQEIRTPHKQSIRFKYDEKSRIFRAEDDQGHWADTATTPTACSPTPSCLLGTPATTPTTAT